MNRKPKLVRDWRSSWRWLSMRLAALGSAAVAYVLASPEILLTTLNQLPPEIRAIFPPFAGLALFAIVAAARLWNQQHRETDDGGK